MLVLLIMVIVVVYFYAVPMKDTIKTCNEIDSHLIKSNNRIEMQSNKECAAFSTAYILRHFGHRADGLDLYRSFPRKLLDGTVSPKGILVYFKRLGFRASFLSAM